MPQETYTHLEGDLPKKPNKLDLLDSKFSDVEVRAIRKRKKKEKTKQLHGRKTEETKKREGFNVTVCGVKGEKKKWSGKKGGERRGRGERLKFTVRGVLTLMFANEFHMLSKAMRFGSCFRAASIILTTPVYIYVFMCVNI